MPISLFSLQYKNSYYLPAEIKNQTMCEGGYRAPNMKYLKYSCEV